MNLHSTSHPSLKTHIAKGAPPKKGSLAPSSLAGRRSNVWTTLDHTWQLSKHKLILRMRNHVKNDQDTQCVLFLEPKHRVAPVICACHPKSMERCLNIHRNKSVLNSVGTSN